MTLQIVKHIGLFPNSKDSFVIGVDIVKYVFDAVIMIRWTGFCSAHDLNKLLIYYYTADGKKPRKRKYRMI